MTEPKEVVRRAARPAAQGLASLIARIPSGALRRQIVARIYDRDPEAVIDALVERISGPMTLAHVQFDLNPAGRLDFEDLAGLFPSSPLTFGVSQMTPRQLGYLFGLVRRTRAKTALEVGRYKGGSALTLAAALGPGGTLWSIDNGMVVAGEVGPPADHDEQLSSICKRFGLDVRVLVADSRTVVIDSGPFDVVLIDAAHSYEAAHSDFARWATRVRPGGHVLLDDAFSAQGFVRHVDAIGRVVQEAVANNEFRLVRTVDRMAHLERRS